nr:nitroreductase family protein [Dietzia psychralcaliphila]
MRTPADTDTGPDADTGPGATAARTPFDLAEADRLLTTTRSVRRRLDLDRPVPREVLLEAIDVAQQAPTADNAQNWRWLVVTEPETREELGELFRTAWEFHRSEMTQRAGRRRDSASSRRNMASAETLAMNVARVPALVIPCVLGAPPDPADIDARWMVANAHKADGDPAFSVRPGHLRSSMFYGSVYPAVWSLQLALRARGLGSTVTCLHLPFRDRAAEILGIPRGITQICMLPVAYTIGTDFRPARRHPAAERTFWESWGRGQ